MEISSAALQTPPLCCVVCKSELHGLKKKFCSKKCSRDNDVRKLRVNLPVRRAARRERRQRISEMWGRDGNHSWFEAQNAAVDILLREGYEHVRLLCDYFTQSPFDICGDKTYGMHVFQITTRTHTAKRKQHRLAKDLRLFHKVIFVSMKLGAYIIKDFSPSGLAEITREEEVIMARRF